MVRDAAGFNEEMRMYIDSQKRKRKISYSSKKAREEKSEEDLILEQINNHPKPHASIHVINSPTKLQKLAKKLNSFVGSVKSRLEKPKETYSGDMDLNKFMK